MKMASPQAACKPATTRPADKAGDEKMRAYYGPHACTPLHWAWADRAETVEWHPQPMRWLNIIRRAERPQCGADKGGEAICYVALEGPPYIGVSKTTGQLWKAAEGTTQRKYENLLAVYCIGFDYDAGEISADEMIERLTALGYEAVFYTTHSHLKTVTHPTEKDIAKAKALKLDLIAYMTGEDKLPRIKGPAPQLLPDGGITHAPWPKFRAVLLLKAPFVIGKNPANVARYKDGYHALAKMIGASTFDVSCSDPGRIHYPPKKRSTDAPYVYKHIRGEPVDFDAIVKGAPSYKAHAARSSSAPSGAARASSRKVRTARETRASEAMTIAPVTDDALADALDALARINPDIAHPKWMSLLWALHSEFSDTPVEQQALEAFIAWSRRGAKFNATKDDEIYLRDEWATANKDGGSTIATLFHIATEHGHRRVAPIKDTTPSVADLQEFARRFRRT